MERDKALDKIRKLLAKANDPCNVHEAAAAAEAAQRLMILNKIQEADLDGVETVDDEPIVEADLLADSRQLTATSWQQMLLNAIARNNFCRLVVVKGGTGRKDRLQVFGRSSDLDAVSYLYRAMANQINVLCDAWARLNDGSRRDRNSFRYGAAVTISQRLSQARIDQEREFTAARGSTALVPLRKADAAVDQHIQERYRRLRPVHQNGPSSWYGYKAGKEAGHEIQLGRSQGALAGGMPSLPMG